MVGFRFSSSGEWMLPKIACHLNIKLKSASRLVWLNEIWALSKFETTYSIWNACWNRHMIKMNHVTCMGDVTTVHIHLNKMFTRFARTLHFIRITHMSINAALSFFISNIVARNEWFRFGAFSHVACKKANKKGKVNCWLCTNRPELIFHKGPHEMLIVHKEVNRGYVIHNVL